MEMTNMFLGYIKPQLLILVPLTWATGKALKDLRDDNTAKGLRGWIRKMVSTGHGLTRALYMIDMAIAIAIGFLDTSYAWVLPRIIHAVVLYGAHGAVCAYMATRLYDLARDGRGE